MRSAIPSIAPTHPWSGLGWERERENFKPSASARRELLSVGIAGNSRSFFRTVKISWNIIAIFALGTWKVSIKYGLREQMNIRMVIPTRTFGEMEPDDDLLIYLGFSSIFPLTINSSRKMLPRHSKSHFQIIIVVPRCQISQWYSIIHSSCSSGGTSRLKSVLNRLNTSRTAIMGIFRVSNCLNLLQMKQFGRLISDLSDWIPFFTCKVSNMKRSLSSCFTRGHRLRRINWAVFNLVAAGPEAPEYSEFYGNCWKRRRLLRPLCFCQNDGRWKTFKIVARSALQILSRDDNLHMKIAKKLPRY